MKKIRDLNIKVIWRSLASMISAWFFHIAIINSWLTVKHEYTDIIVKGRNFKFLIWVLLTYELVSLWLTYVFAEGLNNNPVGAINWKVTFKPFEALLIGIFMMVYFICFWNVFRASVEGMHYERFMYAHLGWFISYVVMKITSIIAADRIYIE